MKTFNRIATFLATASLAWSCAVAQAEDIDLFASGGAATTSAPNLIIILDNTANWNQPLGPTPKFAALKSALAAAVGTLSDATGNINVGLMLFNEAGGAAATGGQPTGSHDGAYVRYAARTMTDAANRAQLIALISGLDATNDGGAAAQPTMALEEARRYLGGMQVLNGNNTGAKVDRSGLSAGQSIYVSPVASDGCQRNFVLFVSSGPPAADDASIALPFVRALNGGAAPAQLPLPAPYPPPMLAATQDAAPNWMDEYAALLRKTPYPGTLPGSPGGTANSVVSYAIALHDPGNNDENTSTAASGRALILNAAIHGGGKYFDATDASSLALAIRAILAEAQAVDGVFAAPALPVSVNPLGTYLNQIYMGMFRPDPTNSPRWVGNVKQYQFAYNSSTGTLELVDALNRSAINAAGGFIAPSAQSFWSTAQTTGPILPAGSATVDFFAAAPAGTGLTPAEQKQEAPDGEVVEKGAVAQQIRAAYLGNQSARNVYTCPAAGCLPRASLPGSASHAFNTVNLPCAGYQSAFNLSSGSCATELPLLIDWIRGADNTSPSNEAAQGPAGLGLSPVRASVHGDVLHARPLLVNYGAAGIVAFYGANDGTLRAVRAGQPESGGGRELWAFIAPETFSKFKRLRDASPPLQLPSPSSGLSPGVAPSAAARPKDYFFDGAITNHEVRDGTGNVASEYLFATARRGGSFIYAFDVTTADTPRFLWKHAAHDGTDSAFDDLAMTFSGARAAIVAGYANPVVIFGGGYQGGYDAGGAPLGEDADPAAPCLPTAAQGCGHRIFVLDAATGNVVKTFQINAGNGGNLVNSVAADLALVDAQGGGVIDRAYAADTGGNIWRIDFDQRGISQWQMYKLATVGDAANPRKFLYAPDVVVTRDYAAVLIGSGDREKPLKAAGTDRFYMFKDKETGATVAGHASGWPINGEETTGDRMADATNTPPDRLREALAATGNNGWFHTLTAGEKVVNGALTAAGITYFGTNRPAPPSAGTCKANLGVAKAYGLSFNTGTAGRDLNADGVLDARDAAVTLAGGGLPPTPVAGWVNVVDAATNATAVVPFVIGTGGNAGAAIGLPSQSAPAKINLNLSKARKKTYWYSKPPQ
jgi:type IV pilus assembly protein PilY1